MSNHFHSPYTPGDKEPQWSPEDWNQNPQWLAVQKEPRRPHTARTFVACMLACVAVSGVTAAGVTTAMQSQNSSAGTNAPSSFQVTTAAAGTGDLGIAGVVAKSADTVVEISTEALVNGTRNMQYVTSGAGSGVILSGDGYIVTNYHVIEGTSSILVRLSDGSEYTASLVGIDEKTDLAVLKIDATGLPAVTFADSGSIRVGDLAVAIGNPLGELGGTVTSGIISALDREITIDGQTMTLLQTSAAVNPGNSGGGLFDGEGNLLGIVNAKSSGTDIEGLAFAIPANTVKAVVAELIDNGYVTGRPQLGIGVVEISDPFTAMRYGVQKTGVYIAQSQSPQLKSGDLLVTVGGVDIASAADVGNAIAKNKMGDAVPVTIERDGVQLEVSVTLTEQVPENLAAEAQNPQEF